MKRIYILLAIFIIATSGNAQENIVVEYSCNLDYEERDKTFLTFKPSIHAERIVDEILNSVGLDRNFELLAAECGNVLATEI